MTPWLILGVSAAGALGAATRFLVDALIARSVRTSAFPYATVVINITGSFLLGVITGLVLFDSAPSQLQVLVGVGFCSSYTTFSTAMWDAVMLARRGRRARAVVYTVSTMAGTCIAAGIGLWSAAALY